MMVPDSRTRSLSVLVVDDYPDTASSLAAVLSFEGFATRAALSGAEALSAAAIESPDVLIIEPRTIGCGWELAPRIAEMAAVKKPLVVVYTTDTTIAGRRAAYAAGVGLYLLKPGDPESLVAILRGFEQTSRTDLPTSPWANRRKLDIDRPIPLSGIVLAAM